MWRRVSIVTLAASIAHAEPPQVGENPFVTLDRVDGRTRGRVELAYGTSREFGDFSVFEEKTINLELHGQWVEPKRGLGVYATAGMSKLYFEGDGRPIEYPGVELGGLFARRVHEGVDLVTHLGITRTPSDPGFVGFARITDALARSSSHPTWMRLMMSPVFRSGIAVARIGVGLDVPVGDKEDVFPARNALRLGAGVGIQRGAIRAGLEGVIVTSPYSLDHPFAGALTTVAATYRFALEKIELYAAVVVPIKIEDAGKSLILGVDVIGPRRR